MGDLQVRYDIGRLAKSRPGPAGSVLVPASVTRSGVFTYHLADGSVQREYRPPEEVFSADSLASLAHAPVTDGHPPEMVNPQNWGDVSCGSVVDHPKQDGVWVVGDLQINKADVISKVDTGDVAETSCGYRCRTEFVSGVTTDGEAYDCIQRDIRYNHVALGPLGWARAGRESRLRLDSNSAIQSGQTTESIGMKIRIDGIEYDIAKDPDAARQAMERSEQNHAKRLDEKDSEIKGLKQRLDEKDSEIKTLKIKLDEKPDIPKLVAARAALENRATKFSKFDSIEKVSDRDLMIGAIQSTRKDFDPEGKSDEYVCGVFDALVEPQKQDSQQVRDLRSNHTPTTQTTTPTPKPAHQRPLAASASR